MDYEEKSSNLITKLYSVGLGLIPLLAILDFNIAGIFLDRLFLLFFAVFSVVRLITRHSIIVLRRLFISILLYCLVFSFNVFYFGSCGFFGLMSLWIVLGVDLCVSPGLIIDYSVLKKTIVLIALVSSVLIFIQYLLYYGIGQYWNPIPSALYRKEVINSYSFFLSSGLENGLLRPSAIFLEPSHFAEYSILAVVMLLFSGNENYKKAIIVSTGILLSTSGLGIISVVFAWGYKLFFDRDSTPNRKLTIIFGAVVAMAIAYFIIESMGIANIFFSKFRMGSYNSGFISRFGEVHAAFHDWTFGKYLIGEGYDSTSNYWLPGYFSILRQVGIIGLILFIVVMINIFRISDKLGKCLVVVYAWLLLVAEVSTMTYMVFYLSPACFISLKKLYRLRE